VTALRGRIVTAAARSKAVGRLSVVLTAWLAGSFVYWVWGPGLPTNDASGQLNQYLTGYYTDWQSPVLSVIWGWWFSLLGYPRGPFLFDLSLMLIAIGFWVALLPVGWPWRCAAFLFVVLWPSTLLQLANVVRDVPFSGVSLLSIALVTHARRRSLGLRWPWVVASLLCFLAVVSFRQEGVISVLPACAGLVTLFPSRWSPRRFVSRRRLYRVAGLGLTACIFAGALFGISSLLEYDALGAQTRGPYQYMMLWDLSSLSASSGRILVPRPFQEDVTLAFLRKYSLDMTGDYLFWPAEDQRPDSDQMVLFRYDARDLSVLRSDWLHAVVDHPVAYLRHRLAVAASTTSFLHPPPWPLVPALNVGTTPAYLCVADLHVTCGTLTSPGARWLEARGSLDKNWVIFREWPYTAVSLAILVISVWRRKGRSLLAMLLAASGVLEVAAFVFAGTGYAYRYTEWPMLAAVTAAVTYVSVQATSSSRRRLAPETERS